MKETLKFLRESHKYSQTDLAAFLGISRQMYIKYENGEVEPPVAVVKKLCDKYGVGYDVLINNLHKKEFDSNHHPDVMYKIPSNREEEVWQVADSGGSKLESYNYTMACEYAKKLKYEELFKLLRKVVRYMECRNDIPFENIMSKAEAHAAIDAVCGKITREDFDPEKERDEYLYEKYGKS